MGPRLDRNPPMSFPKACVFGVLMSEGFYLTMITSLAGKSKNDQNHHEELNMFTRKRENMQIYYSNSCHVTICAFQSIVYI